MSEVIIPAQPGWFAVWKCAGCREPVKKPCYDEVLAWRVETKSGMFFVDPITVDGLQDNVDALKSPGGMFTIPLDSSYPSEAHLIDHWNEFNATD